MALDQAAAQPIPRAAAALPLLGHAVSLLRDPLAFLTTLANGDSDLAEIRIGPLRAVVICDPELTAQVLQQDQIFDKGGPVFTSGRRIIGNNLVTCPHNEHRRQRRMTQPTFARTRLAGYGNVMTDQVDNMTRQWSNGQIFDLPVKMSELTIKIVMKTMFSGELAPSVMEETLTDVPVIADGILSRTVLPSALSRLPTAGNRRYALAGRRMRAALDDLVVRRRTDTTDYGDLLSALMATRDDGEGVLSETEISDQLMIFFIAGAETTGNALTWALHLIAEHPDIERRLHSEVDRVLAGGPARYEQLSQLELTGHIVSEALRLYPPVWILTRTVSADTWLGGYFLPSGTTVIYSPYLIHHRGDLYENPERFDPDRWSDERAAIPRTAFIPFSAAARKCIGDVFGLAEATIALATITARWRLQPVPGGDVRPVISTVLRPRDLRMRVTARH
ncbi:cytochrome P450 [Nocardia sp. NBC_00565]|uniref:cytochrome P450 n=1 Tax=Nocardia sp. NBC_00565 TaxID=2975993 RepID=UPI002E81C287|nr:cytochrome P450 [Nocardia sp. NBC_00565]WUC03496.1 cytochrome P450 [Nocardia sp. NBC_00565]